MSRAYLDEIADERSRQWGQLPSNALTVLPILARERPAPDLGLNTLRAWALQAAATALAALEVVDAMIADALEEGDVGD